MKIQKTRLISLVIFGALVLSAILEFVLCFINGYSELWYTILFFSVLTIACGCLGAKLNNAWLYLSGSAIEIIAFALMLAFPSYLTFAYIIFGAITLSLGLFLSIVKVFKLKCLD